jgi:hypothetical protein
MRCRFTEVVNSRICPGVGFSADSPNGNKRFGDQPIADMARLSPLEAMSGLRFFSCFRLDNHFSTKPMSEFC